MWQIIQREQRPDGLYVAAKFWCSPADHAAGKPANLFNDFRFPSLAEKHQRIRRGPNGGLLHCTGAEVQPRDVRAFLSSHGTRWSRHNRTGKLLTDRLGRWRPDGTGKPMKPFALVRDTTQLFDPQWTRESFLLNIDAEIATTLNAYEFRAAARDWTGDRRGTTTVLQINANGNDGWTFWTAGTPSTFYQGSFVQAGGTNDSSDERYDAFFLFTGFDAVAGTVTSATLSLRSYSSGGSGTATTRVKIENSNASIAPTDETDHAARTRHANYVQWDIAGLNLGGWSDSPDIATVVQPIVDLGEAATILLLQDGQQTDYGWYEAQAYETNSAQAAKLTIDHGAAGGSGPGGQPSLLRSHHDFRRPIFRR